MNNLIFFMKAHCLNTSLFKSRLSIKSYPLRQLTFKDKLVNKKLTEEKISNTRSRRKTLNTAVVTCKDKFLVPQITMTNKDNLKEMGRSPYGNLADESNLGVFRGGVNVDRVW